jgi:hypothetical protein
MAHGAANGLDFVLRNGAKGRKYQVETLPGGVIDFDGDGWPDIFCVNGAALPALAKTKPEYWNRLYKNNRDGTFTDVTVKAGLAGSGYGMGVAVGDYDNDGNEDLFVVGVHGNQLYRNNGDGTFSDVTVQAGLNLSPLRELWSVAAAWIDYDNDGRLDLFVSNYCQWEPDTDPTCGGMTPETRVYCHPDLYHAQAMQLFHNNGDGTFTEVTHKDGLPNLLGKNGHCHGRSCWRAPPWALCRERQRAESAATRHGPRLRRSGSGSRRCLQWGRAQHLWHGHRFWRY